MYTRTQILLDPQTKADLAYISEMKNVSMSSLVRRFVAEKVKAEKLIQIKKSRKKPKMSGAEVLLKMSQAALEIEKKYGTTGPIDGALNHDHYLYGAPKKKLA